MTSRRFNQVRVCESCMTYLWNDQCGCVGAASVNEDVEKFLEWYGKELRVRTIQVYDADSEGLYDQPERLDTPGGHCGICKGDDAYWALVEVG